MTTNDSNETSLRTASHPQVHSPDCKHEANKGYDHNPQYGFGTLSHSLEHWLTHRKDPPNFTIWHIVTIRFSSYKQFLDQVASLTP